MIWPNVEPIALWYFYLHFIWEKDKFSHGIKNIRRIYQKLFHIFIFISITSSVPLTSMARNQYISTPIIYILLLEDKEFLRHVSYQISDACNKKINMNVKNIVVKVN